MCHGGHQELTQAQNVWKLVLISNCITLYNSGPEYAWSPSSFHLNPGLLSVLIVGPPLFSGTFYRTGYEIF